MEGGDQTSAWLPVAFAGFVAMFAAVIWLAVRQRRALDDWLETRVAQGWLPDPQSSPLTPEGSRWFRLLTERGFGPLGGTGPLAIERLVVNPRPDPVEAAFVLTRAGLPGGWRRTRRSRWPGEQAGLGVVARLPRRLAPGITLVPQPAAAPALWQALTGLDLDAVRLDDPEVDQSWTVLSGEPAAAAAMLAREPRLRAAFASTAKSALGHDWREAVGGIRVGTTPQVTLLVIELEGERLTLFGGPRAMNQRPFPVLEEAAAQIAAALR